MADEEEHKSVSCASCRENLCQKHTGRSINYIDTTTIHGVHHVFIGKSKIRRLFWLIVVLAAAGGCLHNIVDRILFLASQLTATTISLVRESSLDFPAVTICNLNLVRRSYLEQRGLINLVEVFASMDPTDASFDIEYCQDRLDSLGSNETIDFSQLTFEDEHFGDLFFVHCAYERVNCNETQGAVFVPTPTRLGLCYTFNSGENGTRILKVNGSGSRHGLTVILNIEQDEHIASTDADAGVKMAIHPQGEPGEPDDIGVAVPPGRNAFIGLRERRIRDKSSSSECRDSGNTDSFNFLQDSRYGYSISACVKDCFLTRIAEVCGCVDTGLLGYFPSSGRYTNLDECSMEHLCCLLQQYTTADGCGPDCPAACEYTEYTTSTSYSAFPARYQVEYFTDVLEQQFSSFQEFAIRLDGSQGAKLSIYENLTMDKEYLEENLVSVNIYFEELNLETEVTDDAYDIVSLLSDIGGQFALFLGASVISFIELGEWVLNEVKDRCCFGANDQIIFRWIRRVRKKTKHDETEMGNLSKAAEAEVEVPSERPQGGDTVTTI